MMILCIVFFFISFILAVFCGKWAKKRIRKNAILMIFISGLGMLAGLSEIKSDENETELARLAYGEGDYEANLTVDAEDLLDTYSYYITVPEQILSKQEEQQLLGAAEQEIEQQFLENNSEVQNQIIICETYQNGKVQAVWSFEPDEIVDEKGMVIAEEIPKEGIWICAKIELKCGTSACISEQYFRVMPPNLNEQQKVIKKIEDYLKKQQTDAGKSVKLPQQIDGKKLTWKTKKEYLPEKILLLGGMTIFLLPFAEQSRQKEKEKKRREQLELQYADMVSNLALLVGAGMTVSGAWNKLVTNYIAKCKANKNLKKEVYEEMKQTVYEIQNGMGEERAYERFGERCGGFHYRKFGNLLAQNLRKGTRNLTKLLQQEAEEAFEERKNMARKLGEEAGTKLLFPMLFMLGVIIVILAFPAMQSMQL